MRRRPPRAPRTPWSPVRARRWGAWGRALPGVHGLALQTLRTAPGGSALRCRERLVLLADHNHTLTTHPDPLGAGGEAGVPSLPPAPPSPTESQADKVRRVADGLTLVPLQP